MRRSASAPAVGERRVLLGYAALERRDRLAGGDELDHDPVALPLGRGGVLLNLTHQLTERRALALLVAGGGAQLLDLARELVALVADGPQALQLVLELLVGGFQAAVREPQAREFLLELRPRWLRRRRSLGASGRKLGLECGDAVGLRRGGAQRRDLRFELRDPVGLGRPQRSELLLQRFERVRSGPCLQHCDEVAKLLDLDAQVALGARPAAPPAPARRRQLDDEAAADLELRAHDVAAVGVPVKRRPPRLVGLGDLGAGHALTAPARVDRQRRAPDPAAAHAVPAADDLEPVVRCPLEALELEGDLPDRRHQLCSPASGWSGFSRDVLERATGVPDSVGGGR